MLLFNGSAIQLSNVLLNVVAGLLLQIFTLLWHKETESRLIITHVLSILSRHFTPSPGLSSDSTKFIKADLSSSMPEPPSKSTGPAKVYMGAAVLNRSYGSDSEVGDDIPTIMIH